MKKLIFILFGFVFNHISNAQELTFVATNNGIAPVPAFTLGKPATLLFLTTHVTKNLEFSPDFAYDLSGGKSWFVDTWFHWNQPLKSDERWTATTGADWSTFFKNRGGDTIQALRYLVLEEKITFAQSEKNTFSFTFWYNASFDKKFGSIKGSYLSILYSRKENLNKFSILGNLNFFYLDFSDGTNGLATAMDLALRHEKSGLFIKCQYLQNLTATNVKFAQSYALGITRKLI